jgi:trehalose 6-phosphate phosphatase
MSSPPQTRTREEIIALLRDRAREAAILLDIDGTLAPVVERADEATVPPDTRRILAELSGTFALVACISGRQALQARRMVGLDTVTYVGNHGLERLAPHAGAPLLEPGLEPRAAQVRAFARARYDAALEEAGIRLEDKDAIWAFHWRGVPDPERARALLEDVAAAADAAGLVSHWGRMVLELRPTAAVDKGTAVDRALEGSAVRVALFGGDDTTDLDAFRRIRELESAGDLDAAVCVGVASAEGPQEIATQADVVVTGPGEFRDLLGRLAA